MNTCLEIQTNKRKIIHIVGLITFSAKFSLIYIRKKSFHWKCIQQINRLFGVVRFSRTLKFMECDYFVVAFLYNLTCFWLESIWVKDVIYTTRRRVWSPFQCRANRLPQRAKTDDIIWYNYINVSRNFTFSWLSLLSFSCKGEDCWMIQSLHVLIIKWIFRYYNCTVR